MLVRSSDCSIVREVASRLITFGPVAAGASVAVISSLVPHAIELKAPRDQVSPSGLG